MPHFPYWRFVEKIINQINPQLWYFQRLPGPRYDQMTLQRWKIKILRTLLSSPVISPIIFKPLVYMPSLSSLVLLSSRGAWGAKTLKPSMCFGVTPVAQHLLCDALKGLCALSRLRPWIKKLKKKLSSQNRQRLERNKKRKEYQMVIKKNLQEIEEGLSDRVLVFITPNT